MPTAPASRRTEPHRGRAAGGLVLLGSVLTGWHLASVLSDQTLAGSLIGGGLWRRFVALVGGQFHESAGHVTADFEVLTLVIPAVLFGMFSWLAGAVCIAHWRKGPWKRALADWGLSGWLWWLLPALWELLFLISNLVELASLASLLVAALPLFHSVQWAGWLATGCALAHRDTPDAARTDQLPWSVWAAMGLYFAVFATLNGMLYAALQLPHGDSAMYEEHLWNLLHGKGFRSYLDNGRLFLGEHIQVIHLLLIPLYVLWPSQVLLELCQSAALAAGAIPVYSLARRHTGSSRAGACLAIAYLLYVPLQFLDIAIDFKTFRPNSFEIPLFLLAFDALERGRWKALASALFLALLCQEDAAVIMAPFGLWLCLFAGRVARDTGAPPNRLRLAGIFLAVFGVVYVGLIIKVILPWFRGGADVHFAQYFNELGESSNSIVETVLTRPGLVLAKLFDVESQNFAMTLLVPLGFLPLLSPGRLAIAAPLFAVLTLSQITNSPQHHFHAPLVPVLLWSAAAGAGNAPRVWALVSAWIPWLRKKPRDSRRISPAQIVASGRTLPTDGVRLVRSAPLPKEPDDRRISENIALFAALCAGVTGIFLGLSPASIGFWDPDSSGYWKAKYVPGERSRQLPSLLSQIPPEARVASTDYIHPRFTHYDRSYDYSAYRPIVPEDTDYIVIDARHPYSGITRAEQIPEYRDHPDQWEQLPDHTNGYFIVLKRKWKA